MVSFVSQPYLAKSGVVAFSSLAVDVSYVLYAYFHGLISVYSISASKLLIDFAWDIY